MAKKDYSPYRDPEFVDMEKRMEGRSERIHEHAEKIYHIIACSYIARAKAIKALPNEHMGIMEDHIVIRIKDILPLIRAVEHGK